MNRTVAIILVTSVLSLLLNGCAKKKTPPPPPPPQPTIIDAVLTGSDELNPDINGRASPIVARVYQLKATGSFDLADFDSLYADDKNVLSDDLITKDEYHLSPGETISYKKKPVEDAHYLAIIGAYRNLNNAVWKKTIRIPARETSSLDIQFNRLHIDIVNLQ